METGKIFTSSLGRVCGLALRIGTLTACSALSAQPAQGNGSPRQPPPQALEACQSLSRGQPCSFTGRQGGAVKGNCQAPEGKPLACKPQGAPASSPRAPKQ